MWVISIWECFSQILYSGVKYPACLGSRRRGQEKNGVLFQAK